MSANEIESGRRAGERKGIGGPERGGRAEGERVERVRGRGRGVSVRVSERPGWTGEREERANERAREAGEARV